jgi:hypothetical protein
MANPTKEQTVRRALEALANHYDPATARFATLGGSGYELAVWRALEIPREHCWLIERDQQKARRLIARARPAHVYVGELRDFPKTFRSVSPGGMLDVFHWDLCETVEPNARELRAVFPLIAGGTSRCLLVTAADQRGNRSLDQADRIAAWWTWLLGSAEAHRAFWHHLVDEHDRAQRRGWTEAASANAATRELSAFLHLLLVLCDFQWEAEVITRGKAMGLAALDRTFAPRTTRRPTDIPAAFAGGREPSVTFVPDELVRSLYYSRVDGVVGRSFRMRTTGLHLARLGSPIPIRDAAQRVATLITATPLQIIAPGSNGRIRTVTIRGQHRKEFTMQRGQAEASAAGAAEATPSVVAGPPLKRLSADLDALSARLAQRLHALGLPTEQVVALSRSAIGSLETLAEIEGRVTVAEEAVLVKDRIRGYLASVRINGAAAASVPANADGDAQPPAAAPAPAPSVATAKRPRRRKLSDDERIELRLRLFRAKHQGDAVLAAEKAKIQTETGFEARGIAGLISTASGRFGASFARATLQRVTGDARKALAAELEAWGFGEAKQLLRAAQGKR